jgi:hypothetical protein
MDRTQTEPQASPAQTPDKHGRVIITVDGIEYRVKPGHTTVANLAKHAQLADPKPPPTMAHVTVLHSNKNEKFSAADEVNIEGGEVFTSTV